MHLDFGIIWISSIWLSVLHCIFLNAGIMPRMLFDCFLFNSIFHDIIVLHIYMLTKSSRGQPVESLLSISSLCFPSPLSALRLLSSFHLLQVWGSLKLMGPGFESMGPGFKNQWDPARFEPRTSRAMEKLPRPLIHHGTLHCILFLRNQKFYRSFEFLTILAKFKQT